MGEMTQSAQAMGRRVQGDAWLDRAIRFGFVVYGVVHLVVAWLALELALGDHSGSANSTGALTKLAHTTFGGILVWFVALGMLALVVWRLLDAAVGHQEESDGGKRTRKRLVSLGKAVIYGAIALSAFRIATSPAHQSKKGGGTDDTTATIMHWPGGPFIVGLIGLAIIAYGLNMARRAWTEKFREHLDAEGQSGDTGQAYIWFGKAGYTAKGVAFVVVGGLFCYAALTHDAKKSGGLDVALHKVLQQPFGQWLLALIAVGIGCYGLFCFARARHLSR